MSLLPQFGFFELVVVAIIALVVVGPRDLPKLMRMAGRMAGQARKMAGEFRAAFDQMARLVLGPEDFDGLDAATRARYVDAFTAMSIAVFAGRFDGYSGQQFQYGGEQEIRPGQVLVTTVLSAPERRSVNIEYLMRQFSGEWRVLDVFLDRRVSEVARQRSEFAAVYHRSGIEGLITEIEANTARQREGS